MKKEQLDPNFEALRKNALHNAKVDKEPLEQKELIDYAKIKEVEQKVRKTYPQQWTAYNLAKTREKLMAEELLLELLDNLEEPKSIFKSPFTINEKIFIMFTYVYSGFSSRRAIAEVEIAKRRGLISKTPHFNSVLNMFKDGRLMRTLLQLVEISALPLKQFEDTASIDATGFSVSNFNRWFNVRTQEDNKKREWMKLNVIIGNKTNVIISVVVSEGTSGDSLYLAPLVQNASRNFELKEISADKAYLSRNNLTTIASAGAIPFIPFKSNSRRNPRGCRLWAVMYDFFCDHKEEFLKSYHRRSNSESAFGMIKKNYRNHIRTKNFTSQTNELLVKCLCHNLSVLVQESFELGLDIDLRECFKSYVAQAEV